MLEVRIGQATDPGPQRTANEDAVGVFLPRSEQEGRSHGWLAVVADGVGGLDMGDVAAKQTVALMLQKFAQAPSGSSLQSTLQHLVKQANTAVHDAGIQPDRRGRRMATTVVACALRYDEATIAHVGDSRCYHIREGRILRMTQDHNFVREQLRQGLITEAEAAESAVRNVLTRSLGPERCVDAETATLQLKPGDALLLCTDGLHGAISGSEIVQTVCEESDPQRAAGELVRRAVARDGSDNVTAQVIRVQTVEPAALYRRRSFRIPGI